VSKITKLNTVISDAKRISFQVYLLSTHVFYYVIVHTIQCISVRGCSIDVNGMFSFAGTGEKLSPDK
jgi:hypothetical protein